MATYQIVARAVYIATTTIEAESKKEACELTDTVDEGWFQEFDHLEISSVERKKAPTNKSYFKTKAKKETR